MSYSLARSPLRLPGSADIYIHILLDRLLVIVAYYSHDYYHYLVCIYIYIQSIAIALLLLSSSPRSCCHHEVVVIAIWKHLETRCCRFGHPSHQSNLRHCMAGGPCSCEDILWMEELLHQLVQMALSPYSTLICNVSFPILTNWCRISSIRIIK